MKVFSITLVVCAFSCVMISSIRADEVEVFAAASLTNVLKEIGADYEKTSGAKVVFNFAASNTLEMQIKAGAPADIFFSADEAKMDDLDKQGVLLKESRRDILSNSLVVVVPTDSTLALSSASQLTDPKITRIALGQPQSVPAGIYTMEYLKKIGIWDQLSARVIPSESVRAALAAVETGNVEAGVVYKTDALQSKKVRIAFEISGVDSPRIAYPAAILLASAHQAAAKKFLDFLAAPASLKTFEKYGFVVPMP